jgi:hypothetical protein
MPVTTMSRTLFVHAAGAVFEGNPETVWIYGDFDAWSRLLLEESGFVRFVRTGTTRLVYALPTDIDRREPGMFSRAIRRLNSFDYTVVLDAPMPSK